MSPFMEDTPDTLHLIATALDRLGTSEFTDPVLALVQFLGAQQVMVFSYTPESAQCFLSYNFQAGAKGAQLAQEYLQGWYRSDPLFERILALPQGDCQIAEVDPQTVAMPVAYRARFFERPNLQGKAAVLISGAGLRLIVNIYWATQKPDVSETVLKILARLTLLHFEANAPDYPRPLSVLSDQERAVCLGILSGRKAEQIAADMGIAPSSVVTYRKRAYGKLGIGSRGHLFALCAG